MILNGLVAEAVEVSSSLTCAARDTFQPGMSSALESSRSSAETASLWRTEFRICDTHTGNRRKP